MQFAIYKKELAFKINYGCMLEK